MFERDREDRVVVPFTGADAGTAPFGWGQKAIWQDMQESGNQFTMYGMMALPDGTVQDAAARLSGLMHRHAALRTRTITGQEGRPYQEVAGSGQIGLDILAIGDDVEPTGYIDDLMAAWPLIRFDFQRDWPLRMAVLRQRGACTHLVWVLSHLVADGAAHFLLLDDLVAAGTAGHAAGAARRPQILDVATSEQEPQLRQLSSRAMRYWEAQLGHVPALTFGEPGHPLGQGEQRYWQVRFSSPAAHLAMLAIAERTGTDASRVTLAVIATAIGRATGVHPLTLKVMMNNRFRPGLADVIAPIAQNSVVTIDVTDTSIDEVVTRTRGAALTAGMRAYYDPDELADVMARLDAERGYPARVTCRVNDQRAMVRRGQEAADAGPSEVSQVTPEQVRQRLTETTLTWLGPRYNMHEQANILVENRSGVVSLHMMWDRRCLTDEQVEALLRAVEEVAVEAAFDPAAPTKVPLAVTT
jgi:hypothetical protein